MGLPRNPGVEADRLSTNNQSQNRSNYAKRYDEDFKVQAVDLLRTSGKPLAQVARELGVSVATLRAWKRRLLGGTPGPVEDQDPGYKEKEALFEEIRQLRRQNAYLERQREILKKAAVILAEESGPSTR